MVRNKSALRKKIKSINLKNEYYNSTLSYLNKSQIELFNKEYKNRMSNATTI